MDFGSKYVFYGSGASPYYSSVPAGGLRAHQDDSSASDGVYDPVYESVNYQHPGLKEYGAEPLYTSALSRQNTVKKQNENAEAATSSAIGGKDISMPKVEESSQSTEEPPKIPPRSYERNNELLFPTIMSSNGPLYPSLTTSTELKPNLYRINSVQREIAPAHKTEKEQNKKCEPVNGVPTELLPQPAYNPYACANTNVISVKMNVLQNNSKVVENNANHYCPNCKACCVNEQVGICNFCNYCDITCSELFPNPIKQDDRTVVLQRNPFQGQTCSPMIIFCVDTSGSMCVTSEGVKQAVIQQIEFLHQQDPNTQVALVSFADDVVVHGDGSSKVVFVDSQLYDTNFLLSNGRSIPRPKPLSHSKSNLKKAIEGLKERGGTALGPAMLLSVAIASNKRGSQVILCTDGRANVGVGSLETEDEYSFCHFFYDETTEIALSQGVAVSILSIRGSDCRLVQLGKIADKTAGQIQIAEVDELTKEFSSAVAKPIIATDVVMTIIADNNMFISSFVESEEKMKNILRKKIGNVTSFSEVTVKYFVGDNGIPPMVPFQLQISYQTLGGDKCMRVITQLRPSSDDWVVVHKEINPLLVATHATKTAAALMLQGDYDNASITTQAHKKLLASVSKMHQKKEIYGSINRRFEQLDRDIMKVQCETMGSGDSALPVETPPALPPRVQGQSSSKVNKGKTTCLDLPLPDVPTHEPSRPKKKKTKLKIAEIGDDIAGKLYKYKKACSNKMSAWQQ